MSNTTTVTTVTSYKSKYTGKQLDYAIEKINSFSHFKASEVTNIPSSTLHSANVQDALNELNSKIISPMHDSKSIEGGNAYSIYLDTQKYDGGNADG